MIAYRQISESDAAAVQDIWRACEEPFLLPQAECAGWAACAEEKPIGFALADRQTGELAAVAILPAYRGHGIARELVRQAEGWIFFHGWGEIRLALPGGESFGAAGFFERLGWVIEKSDCGRYALKKTNPRPVYKLEEHTVADPATGYARLVRLRRGPADQPHRLCLFLDGEHYWRDMYAVPTLEELIRTGSIPPMTFAFLGHVSAQARHEDYTCNERYAQYIGGAVMEWLRAEIPNLHDGGHLVSGLSLSGLMATYLSLQNRKHFAASLSQSGSHWWNHEYFATMARQKSPIETRVWLSVGDHETQTNISHPPTGLFQGMSQIEGVERAAGLFEEIGGTVHCHRFQGGHSLARWHDELGQALTWLLAGCGCRERPDNEQSTR